jgi:hypothetical protein
MALLVPDANVRTMNVLLRVLSLKVLRSGSVPDALAVIVHGMEWPMFERLLVADNIRILPLPPCSPQLSAVEDLWHGSGATPGPMGHLPHAAICLRVSATPGDR